MKYDRAARDPHADGAAIGFVVGAITTVLAGVNDSLRPLVGEPLIVVPGLISATVLGAAFARRVVDASRVRASALALLYGIAVPACVALVVALPVAPAAMALSTLAWRLTIPAALTWLVLIRVHDRAAEGARAARLVAISLAAALFVIRFTQPAFSTSTTGARCISFPGERIESLAWSPDGQWLGLASEGGDAEGIIRLIEQRTGRLVELARGPNVSVRSGIALGPGGETTFIDDPLGGPLEEPSAWIVSPTSVRRLAAYIETPALYDLTWTSGGVAAADVLSRPNEGTKLVWVRWNTTTSDASNRIDPGSAESYSVLAALGDPHPTVLRLRVGTEERRVAWPEDASGEVSVTTDGSFLVFQARRLSGDGHDELYNHLVAQSTVTGDRVVLAEEDTWKARLSDRNLAYLTFPDNANQACIKDVSALVDRSAATTTADLP